MGYMVVLAAFVSLAVAPAHVTAGNVHFVLFQLRTMMTHDYKKKPPKYWGLILSA